MLTWRFPEASLSPCPQEGLCVAQAESKPTFRGLEEGEKPKHFASQHFAGTSQHFVPLGPGDKQLS